MKWQFLMSFLGLLLSHITFWYLVFYFTDPTGYSLILYHKEMWYYPLGLTIFSTIMLFWGVLSKPKTKSKPKPKETPSLPPPSSTPETIPEPTPKPEIIPESPPEIPPPTFTIPKSWKKEKKK